jgi:hypothetical protein
MTRAALRISLSSGAHVALPRFAPCVLELLGRARPRSARGWAPIILGMRQNRDA